MKQLHRFTWIALLSALIILLGMTPIGLIPLGFINVTILCLPVIIGTLLLDLKAGLVLGFVFGSVSTFRLLTAPSTLAGTLLSASPLLAILMCYLPRLVLPIVAHVVHGILQQGKARKLAVPIASAAASLSNTVLYLGMMYVFYLMAGLDSTVVATLILTTGLIAGPAEAVVAAVLVPPILFSIQRVQQRK